MWTQFRFLLSYEWKSAFLVNILQKLLGNRPLIHRYIKQQPACKSFKWRKGKMCNLSNRGALWVFHLEKVITRSAFSATKTNCYTQQCDMCLTQYYNIQNLGLRVKNKVLIKHSEVVISNMLDNANVLETFCLITDMWSFHVNKWF